MPRIKKWSRRQDLEAQRSAEKVWEHRQTGEIAWVSEKVPRDGYYFYACPSEKVFHNRNNMMIKVLRHGYSHRKKQAESTAAHELRKHTEGFDHD
jgi:hypothetical protein